MYYAPASTAFCGQRHAEEHNQLVQDHRTPPPAATHSDPYDYAGRSLASRVLGVLTRRISAKIIVPYVMVILLLATGGTYIVVRLVAGSLEERLINQLVDAGRKANDSMVTLEQEHLRVVRAVAFTNGVDTAVRQGDLTYLSRVLGPIQANSSADFIIVLDNTGRFVFGTELGDDRIKPVVPDPTIASWPSVQSVLTSQLDDLGDKFAEFRLSNYGYGLFTVGPIKDETGRLVGVALVGSRDSQVIERLNRDSLSAITFYDRDGKLIGTTLPYPSLEAGAELADSRFSDLKRIEAARGTVMRRALTIGDRQFSELLGILEVRKQPTIAMGVAVLSEYIQEKQILSRDQLIALFTAAVAAVLLMGLTLARRITAPILALVVANRKVKEGDLAVFVEPTTEDETGQLTESFNEMVEGLRERERIKETFGRYMSPDVSDYLLNNEVKLGGESREITVLMSDIREFTTLSEQLAPEDLVAFLNRYFSRMVRCVLDHHGRVDKYMGDAILASFGAPVPRPDHAKDAVRAAVAMRAALEDFNRELATEGIAPVHIGIGVNTGTVVIGNIGSEDRLEYTIIGDTVNATTRIEELTKELQRDILVGESTYQLARDILMVDRPHLITMRGRSQQSAIYPVIDLDEPRTPPTMVPPDDREPPGSDGSEPRRSSGERRRERDAQGLPAPARPAGAPQASAENGPEA